MAGYVMVKIISRSPGDGFTFSTFTNLVNSITCDVEAYYVWCNPTKNLVKFFDTTIFTKPNVVIGIKDLLEFKELTEFNYWEDSVQYGVEFLDAVAAKHPDKNFIIFTSLENIKLEPVASPNIQFISWGGDCTNQSGEYPGIVPVLDKNFDSDRLYISLNRNKRPHRIATLSYLFGKGYDETGIITYLGEHQDPRTFDQLLDYLPWQFEERNYDIRDAMIAGYPKIIKNQSLVADDFDIYTINNDNDNVGNFNQRLRSKYQNSFVEIVSETTFSARGYLLTEKTLNSIYGCNFPIILSGAGAVAHLRDIGFDMFDDIVDHSYDTITNPIDRIATSIENNKKLLVDFEYVKHTWLANKHRFEKNVDIAKHKMYHWYRNRTIDQFNRISWH